MDCKNFVALCLLACCTARAQDSADRAAVRLDTGSASYAIDDLITGRDPQPDPQRLFVRPRGNLVHVPLTGGGAAEALGDRRAERRPPQGKAAAAVDLGRDEDRDSYSFPREELLELVRELGVVRGVVPSEDDDSEDSPELNIEASGDRLWIRGSRPHLEHVRDIATMLAAERSVRFELECLLVPVERLHSTWPAWREDGPATPAPVHFELLRDPTITLLTTVLAEGHWTRAARVNRKGRLADYEVNQTGVIPVTNPLIETMEDGDGLRARVYRLAGKKDLLVDLALGRFRSLTQEAPLGELWTDLDSDRIQEQLYSTSLSIAPSQLLHAGTIGGRDPLAILLQVRQLSPQLSTAGDSNRESPRSRWPGLRALDFGPLLRSHASRTWWEPSAGSRNARFGGNAGDIEEILELLTTEGTPFHHLFEEDSPPNFEGRLYWHEGHAFTRHVEQFLLEGLQFHTRPVVVDLDELNVSRATWADLRAQTSEDGALPADWRETLAGAEDSEHASHRIVGHGRQWSAVRNARLQSFVATVHNVSGGTGFAILETSDPQPSTCGTGSELRVRVDPAGDSDVRIYLQGADANLDKLRTVQAKFPAIFVIGTGSDSTSDAEKSQPSTKSITVGLPDQTVRYWNCDALAPNGHSVLLGAESDEDGKLRLLIATAKWLP